MADVELSEENGMTIIVKCDYNGFDNSISFTQKDACIVAKTQQGIAITIHNDEGPDKSKEVFVAYSNIDRLIRILEFLKMPYGELKRKN